MANWDRRFFELSKNIAEWSKDRSTKVGAVIVKDNRIISTGYNGFPEGANDTIDHRHDRPLKYKWTEHAERNAIYIAARKGDSTLGATIYLQWYPCVDCARAIIQSGIVRVVCTKPDFNDERWGADFRITDEMFLECNINVDYME